MKLHEKVIALIAPVLIFSCGSTENINAPDTIILKMFVSDCETDQIVCRVKVDIDGAFKGETCRVDPLLSPCGKTCFFIELTLGEHVIKLQKQGYVSISDTVQVASQMSGKNYCLQEATVSARNSHSSHIDGRQAKLK